MTYIQPCADPANDPNDWFISKDGKQYADEEFTTIDDAIAILESANEQGLEGDERQQFIIDEQDRIEAEALKEALRRRRHAVDACFTCYLRTQCLGIALDNGIQHGTWGGYTEEQLKEIRKEQARRKRNKNKE